MLRILIIATALVIVISQPIFGWLSIPDFFNYSLGWALVLGTLDAFLLIVAFVLAAYIK